MATLRELINSVLTRLRMETSLATQIYSEDAIQMGIQHKFDVLFDDYWMPQFMTYQDPYVLDGVTGRITGDLTAKIKRFEDILYVHNDYRVNPLPLAPNSVRLNDLSTPCFQPDSDVTKVFRMIPLNSSGNVYLTYRTKPGKFDDDNDVVNMDEQLMVLGTCYDMLEDDGTNPGASDKFKNMFDARVGQYQRLQHRSISAQPAETVPLNRWR